MVFVECGAPCARTRSTRYIAGTSLLHDPVGRRNKLSALSFLDPLECDSSKAFCAALEVFSQRIHNLLVRKECSALDP
jgi:hypothetical protein